MTLLEFFYLLVVVLLIGAVFFWVFTKIYEKRCKKLRRHDINDVYNFITITEDREDG